MDVVKLILSVVLVGGVLAHLLPDNLCRYAFNCIIVCYACVVLIEALLGFDVSFDVFDSDIAYTEVERYTQHVEVRQRKLFDDIAEKEKYKDAME